MARAICVLLIAFIFATYGCLPPGHVGRMTSPEPEYELESEKEIYLLYPQLLYIQEKLDRASSYFYRGDLESAILLCENLITEVADLQAASPPAAVCDHLETQREKANALLQRAMDEELERDSKIHLTSVLDSLARNHIVEEEIEIIFNWRTKHWIKYFQGKGRRHFRRWLTRVEMYRDIIEPILIENEIPRDLLYLAVIESGLNLNARSRMKAVGPWQFMAGTARIFGLRINWWIDERKDIIASTYAATHYLNHLYNLFGSWPLALASYNAGEYRIAYAISAQKTDNYWRLRLPSQTRWFVPKYMAALAIARNPEEYGFEKAASPPLRFEVIEIDRSTDLKLIAEAAGCSVKSIKSLNPALKKWATPPGMVVELKVPYGKGERCLAGLKEIPPEKRFSWQKHRVRRGETLSNIATRYEVSVAELKRINGIGNIHRIREGKTLMIPVRSSDSVTKKSSSPSYRSKPELPQKIAMKRYQAPAGSKKIVYIVKDHDTLGQIAERFNVGLSKLRGWNNLRYTSMIHPGDRLAVYVPTEFKTLEDRIEITMEEALKNGMKRIVHIVKKGETLSSISRLYEARISDILNWNGRIKRDRLYPGDRITIWLSRD